MHAVSGEQEAFSPPDDIERAVFASKYTASLVALIRNSLGLEVRFVADKVCASVPPNASSAEWQKAYPVAFLNFPFSSIFGYNDSGNNYSRSYITLEKHTGTKMPGSTEYIFFSLADFDKKEDELGTYPEKWLFSLKHSESFDEIPKSFLTDSTFETFFEASNRAGYSIEDEEQYTTAMMNQMDIENSKNWACKKAMAEGEAKGRVESRKEIARKLSQMGMDITAIAEATGLSETEIKTL